MHCCSECFKDPHIKEMIDKGGQVGNCDFCGSVDTFVYTLDSSTDLIDILSDVIGIYEETPDGISLNSILLHEWNIFNEVLPSVNELIATVCRTIYGESFDCNITVRLPQEHKDLYGMLSGRTWKEFSDAIKTKNRFHNSYFKPDQFAPFLSYSITKYNRGTLFYRARIWDSDHGHAITELGAPPVTKRKAGRVSPEGIGVLYLTSDEKTALSEVRASSFDFVSIGTFRLKRDISVVNISALNCISPVVYSSSLEVLAANIQIFGDISREIAKPLRRNDSPLEYLPTQYIAEFIKSSGYAGVQFTSAMGTGGNNLAVFNESLFECTAVHNVEITSLTYDYCDVP